MGVFHGGGASSRRPHVALSVLNMQAEFILSTSHSHFERWVSLPPRCEKLSISHLAFADDLILFSWEFDVWQDSLEPSWWVSVGFRVECQLVQVSIFTFGIQGCAVEDILSVVVWYLGRHAPSAQNLNIDDYTPMQISSLIKSWTSHFILCWLNGT